MTTFNAHPKPKRRFGRSHQITVSLNYDAYTTLKRTAYANSISVSALINRIVMRHFTLDDCAGGLAAGVGMVAPPRERRTAPDVTVEKSTNHPSLRRSA